MQPVLHLLHVLLVEDFLHGQKLDDSTGSIVERGAFLLGVLRVTKRDEEAALAAAMDLSAGDALTG